MPRAVRFAFDTDFDAESPAPEEHVEEELPPPPTFSEAELARAREEGYARGRDEAMAAAVASDERRIADALQAVAGQFEALAPGFERGWERCRRDALTVAGALVRKVAPATMHESAAATVAGILQDVLPGLLDEPRLVIRTADAIMEPLRERLDELTRRSGYPGKVILLADETISPPDCRIEWADGGADFDTARLWREIDEAVERHLNEVDEHAADDAAEAEPQKETVDG